MKKFNFINIFIFILSFSVLLLTCSLFVGSYAFTFEMILFFLAWIIFSHTYVFTNTQLTSMKNFKEDIRNKFLDRTDPINITPELNHKNIRVREYYLSKKYYKQVFYIFLINLLFPIYVIATLNYKRNFSKLIFNFFENNFLINYYFDKKKNIVIEKRKVIENNKEYDVFLYLDGKEEYRYKNKIHRENGAASFYPKEHFFFANVIAQYKYFIFGKEVQQSNLKKELKKHNINNF